MLASKDRVSSSCADELRATISDVALPGDELYETGCRVWNGAVRFRVYCHVPHPGEVDDQPIVAQGAPRPVVAAAANRQCEAVAPRGAHGRLHVLGLPAECDYRRVAAPRSASVAST
jgi:hypothetical protein